MELNFDQRQEYLFLSRKIYKLDEKYNNLNSLLFKVKDKIEIESIKRKIAKTTDQLEPLRIQNFIFQYVIDNPNKKLELIDNEETLILNIIK